MRGEAVTDAVYQAVLMLGRLGLSTEGLGPIEEWSPAPRPMHQRRHDTFWRVVTGILPDDEDYEAFWMTEEASAELRANN